MNIDDFWVGIRCGYPPCCVLFFCDSWYGLADKKEEQEKDGFWWNWRHVGKGYIQCPECIIKEIWS